MRPSQGLFRQEVIDAQAASMLGVVHLAALTSYPVWTVAAVGNAAAVLAWLFLSGAISIFPPSNVLVRIQGPVRMRRGMQSGIRKHRMQAVLGMR